MRDLFDKIMRASIKLCMLTGITFLVTACYGVVNPPEMRDENYQEEQQQLEQKLQKFHSNYTQNTQNAEEL